MIRRDKLVCSVSEELVLLIAQHLERQNVPKPEALRLSKEYRNVKQALAAYSISKIPAVKPSPSPVYEESKSSPAFDSSRLSSSKNKIFNAIKDFALDNDTLTLIIESCDSVEEAMANLSQGLKEFNVPEKPQDEFLYDINSKSGEKKCSICLEFYQDKEQLKIMPCFHMFHAGCLNDWLKKKVKCPVCLNNS